MFPSLNKTAISSGKLKYIKEGLISEKKYLQKQIAKILNLPNLIYSVSAFLEINLFKGTKSFTASKSNYFLKMENK